MAVGLKITFFRLFKPYVSGVFFFGQTVLVGRFRHGAFTRVNRNRVRPDVPMTHCRHTVLVSCQHRRDTNEMSRRK